MGNWNRVDVLLATVSVVALTFFITGFDDHRIKPPVAVADQFIIGKPKAKNFPKKRTGIVVEPYPIKEPMQAEYDDLIVDNLENPRWIRTECRASVACEREAYSI